MKILKSRNVKTPTRGTSKSAGLDFYVPDDFPGVHYLYPGQSIEIQSGIYAKIPAGYALIAMNKSSVSINRNLQVGACVVDEDYQGEIIIHLTNIGEDIAEIRPGENLVQFLLIAVLNDIIEVVDTDIFDETTERGEGKKGSTL